VISVLDTVYNNLDIFCKNDIKVERDWVEPRLPICDGVLHLAEVPELQRSGGIGESNSF
jgi:hypothetical protein